MAVRQPTDRNDVRLFRGRMAFDFARVDSPHSCRRSSHRERRGGGQLTRRALPGRVSYYTQGRRDHLGQRYGSGSPRQ